MFQQLPGRPAMLVKQYKRGFMSIKLDMDCKIGFDDKTLIRGAEYKAPTWNMSDTF